MRFGTRDGPRLKFQPNLNSTFSFVLGSPLASVERMT